MSGRGRAALPWLLGATVVVALVLRAAIGSPALNNDALWALQWGHQTVTGHLPDVTRPDASTPHPLTNVLAAGANLFGEDAAYWILAWVGLLAYGAVLALTFALGRAAFRPAAGVVAAAVVAVMPRAVASGGSAQMDLVFFALVLGATLLAVDRRSAGALSLLVLAGLMRPEAWVLTGAYCAALWISEPERRAPRSTVALAAVALAAPLIWAAVDLALTGSPSFSLTHTRAGAEALGRVRGLANVPSTARVGFENLLSAPVAVIGTIGALLALPNPRARPILGLGTVTALTYVAYGVARVSLLDRYLILPAIVLALGFGDLLTRFVDLHGPPRRAWALIAVGAALVSVLGAKRQLDRVRFERACVRATAAQVADLRRLREIQAPRAVLYGCRRLLVRDRRPIALVADVLHRRETDVVDVGRVRPGDRDAFVTATPAVIASNAVIPFPKHPGGEPRPPGFTPRYGTSRWELSSGGACGVASG
jgi:hypothetical protein